MNNIRPSMLPIAPAAGNSNPSCAPDKELPDDGKSFDSLLQQSSDEPAEDAKAVVPVVATDALTPPTAEEKPDAAVQAGLMAMFGLPALVTLPEPVPTISTDDAAANLVENEGSLGAVPAPVVATNPLTAFAPAIRQAPAVAHHAVVAPVALPTAEAALPTDAVSPAKPESAAPQEEVKPLPPENAVPPLEVANVLALIPPVQAPPVVGSEFNSEKTPALNTKPAPPAIAAVLPTDPISTPLPTPSPVNTSARNIESTATTAPAFSEPDSAPAMFAEPAPIYPAIPATRNEEPLPVRIATPAIQPVESTSPPGAKVISEVITVVSQPENNTGMMAARPGSAMSSTPTLQRSTRLTPATPAEVVPGEIAPGMVPMDGTQTLRNAPVMAAQNGREHGTDDHPENPGAPATPMPEIASPTFTGELLNTLPHTAASAPVKAADVAQVVTHTLQATERLIASGQERVDLSVKLDNGSELTIQLRVANGQVTPIIRTECEPLRVALEQNWSRFSQRGGENELHVTTPVFESPQTSSNMSDPHQQREGRQRAFQEPASEFYQNPALRRNTPLTPPRPATPLSTPNAGVRLYA